MSGAAQPVADATPGAVPAAPTTFTTDPSIAAFKQTLRAYLDAHPEPEGITLDGIAVSAFVFNPEGKLLLVQRAVHDSMPEKWEVPGGASDFEDGSLLHAVVRELWEESGLRATAVGKAIAVDDRFTTKRRNLQMRKFSFMVSVEGYHVKLDDNEHQKFSWVSEDEARVRRCGDIDLDYTDLAQEQAIHLAFEMRKAEAQMEA
ncbi:Uu.00g079880.m01.CDS01 [Anthostomella pinea]|uniref:Uu.00g079880.m01.CDS01 n=1 Tax=Anthostomella pinea TaxID=933095 RepID=A0AAI8VLI4_9PEZI|nr:Uu.00g079880.m01.CDS01 [Anthostomella pinea]